MFSSCYSNFSTCTNSLSNMSNSPVSRHSDLNLNLSSTTPIIENLCTLSTPVPNVDSVFMNSLTPRILELETPDHSIAHMSPSPTPRIINIETPATSDLGSIIASTSSETSALQYQISESESEETADQNAHDILKNIRIKNLNRITIATLNINSLASKFEHLREIIGNNIDVLTIQETKLDPSFPKDQFLLEGYSEP